MTEETRNNIEWLSDIVYTLRNCSKSENQEDRNMIKKVWDYLKESGYELGEYSE